MSAALESVTARMAPATLLAEVQMVWADAAGEAFAAASQPTSERDGVVTVSCVSSVWAQELDLMAGELTPRLNAALGGERVRSLRCVATPVRR